MRRRSPGLLVPGLVLTMVATFGVVVLFAVGSPVLPGGGERAVRIVGDARRPSSLTVPTASRTPTPSRTTAPAEPAPPSRTTPPSRRPGTSAPAVPPPPASSRPAAPSCTAGSARAVATGDAYVDQAMPTRSYGTGGLAVASRDKGRNRRALLRFTVPSVPRGCTLRSATLTMTAKDVSGRTVLVSRASRAWSEASVTWNTAPSPAGAGAAARITGKTIVWNVTGHVAAGAPYGFVLRDAAEGQKNVNQTTFADRTGRTPPVLTLRWS